MLFYPLTGVLIEEDIIDKQNLQKIEFQFLPLYQ